MPSPSQIIKKAGSTAGKLASALRRIPERLRDMNSPKKVAEQMEAVYARYQQEARSGIIERITSHHPDPKLAQMAADFESMLDHPLARKYLKHKPELFVSKSNFPNPSIVGEKIIDVPRTLVEHLTPKELKAIVGHELGHLVRGDTHPRAITLTSRKARKSNQQMERMADKLGVVLSESPEALKSSLEKIAHLTREYAKERFSTVPKPVSALLNKLVDRNFKQGNRSYPSLRSRKHTIDTLAEGLQDPHRRSWAERCLNDSLADLHDQHGCFRR